MKTILAQLEYTNTVKKYDLKGVLFRTCLYAHEEHPETHKVFYEREDDAHLLKVICNVHTSVCINCNHSQTRGSLVIQEVVGLTV